MIDENKTINGMNESDEELEKLKQKLEQIIEYKTTGSIIRSKTRDWWFNEGEKNTKYFLNLEKKIIIKKQSRVWELRMELLSGQIKIFYKRQKTSIKSYIHPVKHVQTCTTVRSILKIIKSMMIYKKNHGKEYWNCKSAWKH